MAQLAVYAAERAAGLAERIRDSRRIAMASVAQLAEPPAELHLSKRALARVRGRVKAGTGDPDLHHLKTLLVSTGVNANDDGFDRAETWAARHTPEDKPFNYEHVGDDIIGHITGCHVVDEARQLVDDTTVVDELPAKFHIVTAAVLYKCWEDETLQERMDNILAEIAKGEWFVSMEALFSGFDYLLLPLGKPAAAGAKVVARNKDTAFLTKHLRAYGGDGVYEKYRVCRLLRHITFSGKGLVRKPANPESVIFDDTEDFASDVEIVRTAAELGYGTANGEPPTERDRAMAQDNDTRVGELQAQNKALQEKVETLTASLKDHDSKAVKARLDGLEAEVTQLRSAATAAEEKAKAAEAASKDWQTKAAEQEKAAAEAKAQLEAVRQEQRTTARLHVLMTKLEMEEAKAREMVAKLAGLSDDAFTAHADYMSEKLADYKKSGEGKPLRQGTQDGSNLGNGSGGNTIGTPPFTAAKQTPKSTDKPAPDHGSVKPVKGSTNDADPKVLKDATPVPDAALAVASVDGGVEKTRASIVKYMAGVFGTDKVKPADEK